MRATITRFACLGVSLLAALGAAWSASSVVSYVQVTPDGTFTPARLPNSGPYTADFVVTNTDPGPGQAYEDFNIICGGGGGVTCTGVSQTIVSLAPGQFVTVTATYTVAGSGSGEINLTAMSDVDPEWDEGYFNVPISSVSVTPDGAITATRTPNTGGYSETFTVQNIGGASDTYILGCAGDNVSCGAVTPLSVTLGAGAQQNVTVSYSTGPEGPGTLTLTAVSATVSDAGFFTVPITLVPGLLVQVTPDQDTVLAFRSATGLQQRFLVKNSGAVTHAYTLALTCTGAASGCSMQPTSLTLAAGESRPVTVTYQATTSATGLVKLQATQSGQPTVKDSGWVPLRTVAAPAPVISLAPNPGRAVARGLCLTIAAGPSAAYECGDLRIVHPLPAIRTLNRERQPVLLYNSGHAAPYPVIVAHVTLPTGTLPDSVEAVLKVNGVQKAISRWGGGNWAAGSTRQIGLGYDATTDTSKVYDYTLEVATIVGASRYATVLSGKLIIVNRATSAFGAGWWLAGLERLELLADGSKLWIGGDGSARQYVSAGTNVWVAPGVARPDTIKLIGSSYIRVLAGGDTIKFNTSGQHVSTTNRLGHQTTFTYTSGRLATITLPSQGGSQRYQFAYAGSPLKLATVTDTLVVGHRRQTVVTQSSGKVTQIKDPDSTTVGFAYTGNRITSRTDRRGTVTRYSYGVANKLTRAKIELSATDSIRVGFQPAESAGFFTASPRTATDTAQVYTTFWGARQYATGSDFIAQWTKFWLDPFGAPRRIKNVRGDTTLLSRDDAQYRALVTWSRAPNGRVLKAGYDGRGNVAFSSDSTNQNATTRYVWDGKWNVATRMVPPLGDSVVMGYDQVTGNRLWQQDARGPLSRVTYTYWTSGNKNRLLRYVDPPPAGQPYEYDYVGTLTNLTSVKTPLGIQTRVAADAWGRDTLSKGPIGSGTIGAQTDSTWTRTTYDVMDRVVGSESYGPLVRYTNPRMLQDSALPDLLEVVNTYDAEGNLTFTRRYADQNAYLTSEMRTTYTYDRANRPVTVTNSGKDSTVYDPAGNVVRTITARGHIITMTYDSLNRLIRRQVPQVDYAQAGCTEHGLVSGCGFVFPFYPNLNGTDLRIAARTDTFTYDSGGNMARAWNNFARVSRTYNLDGTVATDTLRLRKYGDTTDTAFLTHVYVTTFGYDLEGRRSRLTHPTNIDPGSAVDQLYTYDATGALLSVRDVKSNYFRFYYDAQGRPDSLTSPGGWERYTYDADGRMIARTDNAGGSLLQRDSLTYDQRGMIATVAYVGGSIGWTASNVYSGLGKLVLYDAQGSPSGRIAEEYRPDGLSSVTWRRNLATAGYDPEHQYNYDLIQSRIMTIVGIWPTGGPPKPQDWYPDTTYNSYDAAGNVRYAGWRQRYQAAGAPDYQATENFHASASFYGADGKLMVQQLYRDSVNFYGAHLKKRGIYEEYWYDALGRRILVRRRADSLCTAGASFCASTLERFVWDGDQLLYELRAPGGDGLNVAQLNVQPPYTGDYKQLGRVAYTHGPGIDAPLDLIRMDYNGAEYVVIPHENWRGAYGAGTNTAGGLYGFDFQWPADFRGSYGGDDGWNERGLPEWFGSLIQDKSDQTGLMYKRNRYYDPNTGRFTQEDPLGLAGGLNLYGFADGDPVNFSDPFGLCPVPFWDCPLLLAGLGEAAGVVAAAPAVAGGAVAVGEVATGAALAAAPLLMIGYATGAIPVPNEDRPTPNPLTTAQPADQIGVALPSRLEMGKISRTLGTLGVILGGAIGVKGVGPSTDKVNGVSGEATDLHPEESDPQSTRKKVKKPDKPEQEGQ